MLHFCLALIFLKIHFIFLFCTTCVQLFSVQNRSTYLYYCPLDSFSSEPLLPNMNKKTSCCFKTNVFY